MSLDTVEASSLCYLIAFDLARFELGYALGTEHPGVAWSDHIQPQVRNLGLPGPDGIGTIAPLVSTGLVAPEACPQYGGDLYRRIQAYPWSLQVRRSGAEESWQPLRLH